MINARITSKSRSRSTVAAALTAAAIAAGFGATDASVALARTHAPTVTAPAVMTRTPLASVVPARIQGPVGPARILGPVEG